MIKNVTRCKKCNFSLIGEESQNHVCSEVIDYEIKGSTLWVYDGHSWYPRKLLHLSKDQKNPTEFSKYKNRRQGNSTFI